MDDLTVPRTSNPRLRFRRAVLLLLLLLAAGEVARRLSPWIRREFGYRLAARQIDSGRLDEAERQLDTLISENPRDTRARLALVELYRREGRMTEAEETLQRAVELGLPIQAARPAHDLLGSEGVTTPATAAQPRPRVNR